MTGGIKLTPIRRANLNPGTFRADLGLSSRISKFSRSRRSLSRPAPFRLPRTLTAAISNLPSNRNAVRFMLPTIFQLCQPRADVLSGQITESDFAADLAQVLRKEAPEIYREAGPFFANSHPTRGLQRLMTAVCARLNGDPSQVGSVFRLGTKFGGGKTHALIALSHLNNGLGNVANIGDFINPALLPAGTVRVAAFDGENADPSNGRPLGGGLRAFTPWGELAFGLRLAEGYEIVRRSDEEGMAPGADTLRELIGAEPTIILLDELAVYLRKLKARSHDLQRAAEQLTAFLTVLFKAVESSPRCVLVYTLAVGKDDGKATDAYGQENQILAAALAENESVSGRKATMLDPTEDDETVQILRRRLFTSVDSAGAADVVAAYQALWDQHRDILPPAVERDQHIEAFRAGYPLHPELIETLKEKTATLSTFQRVRGMLRLLARTVAQLWAERPSGTHAIHLAHIDPGNSAINSEIMVRLGQDQFASAVKADISATPGDAPALAQQKDSQFYSGLAPYASLVAKTVFWHTLAHNDQLKGCSPARLRYSVLAPGIDVSFLEDARTRFTQDSAYLDDRPNSPLRFLAEANLTQIIRRQEQEVDPTEIRSQLNDRIKSIFKGQTFELIPFPSGPHEVPDDSADGKPLLCVLGYDAVDVRTDQVVLPELVARLFDCKGASHDFRKNRNNVVFLCVDTAKRDEMRDAVRHHLALLDLQSPAKPKGLAPHQNDKIKTLSGKAAAAAATTIQSAYRHLFYPSRTRKIEGADVDLSHAAIEAENASANPGAGQLQVQRVLRDANKLRLPEDDPDSPSFVKDRTPLKKGHISTGSLRSEFRLDVSLPMLVGDDVFRKLIRRGIEFGDFVYQSGDFIWAKDTPPGQVKIDEESFVYTAAYAKENGVWPRPARKETPEPDGATRKPEGGDRSGDGGGSSTSRTGDSGRVNEPPVASNQLQQEGVLKEALTHLWEAARAKKWTSLARLDVRAFDIVDGLKLIGPMGSVPAAAKQVFMTGMFETSGGSTLEMKFAGTPADAAPFKEFLEQQIRGDVEKDFSPVTFIITFQGDGLSLAEDAPEKLAERLTRHGTGASQVTAIAQNRV